MKDQYSLDFCCYAAFLINLLRADFKLFARLSIMASRKDEISCVQLTKDAKAKLDKLGTKKDTYESIILNLMPKSDESGESNDE